MNMWSSDRPNGVQMMSSSTPMTSVGIVTELLRVIRDHVKARVVDIDERVNITERVEV